MLSTRHGYPRDEVLEGLVGAFMATMNPEDAEGYLTDFLRFAIFDDAAGCEAFAFRVRETAAWLRAQ